MTSGAVLTRHLWPTETSQGDVSLNLDSIAMPIGTGITAVISHSRLRPECRTTYPALHERRFQP